jgi:hypothetical protein
LGCNLVVHSKMGIFAVNLFKYNDLLYPYHDLRIGPIDPILRTKIFTIFPLYVTRFQSTLPWREGIVVSSYPEALYCLWLAACVSLS